MVYGLFKNIRKFAVQLTNCILNLQFKKTLCCCCCWQGASLETKPLGGGGHKVDAKGEKQTKNQQTLVHDQNSGGKAKLIYKFVMKFG